MSRAENAGRCPRCHRFLIAEETASHYCHIATNGAETIWMDWFSGDGFTDENGDYVRVAKGLNGILYSLILCKHNPPHNTKRKFTECGPNDDLTDLCLTLCYLRVGRVGVLPFV